VGDNIDIEFVDTCMCGDYHATIDRSEKDALKNVPGAGETMYEQMGQATKADRFKGGGLEQLGAGPMGPRTIRASSLTASTSLRRSLLLRR
jgi:hypothetical protein